MNLVSIVSVCPLRDLCVLTQCSDEQRVAMYTDCEPESFNSLIKDSDEVLLQQKTWALCIYGSLKGAGP